MEINIQKNTSIQSIQDAFNKQYAGLKLEFYNQQHTPGEGSSRENALSNQLTMEQIQKKAFSGNITITDTMKVAELEQWFATNLGISVQIFRKSGNVWLQTSTTDNWTLKQQNDTALERLDSSEETVNYMDTQELE